MRTTAALLLLLLCARSAGGSGPAGHDAHRAGLERLRELENLVQQLLAAHHDDDEQGRRLQVEMDTGGGGHMGAPEEPGSAPKPTGDLGMAGMDGMDGMGHGDKMSAMPSMHASLFLFAPEGGAVGMVVVWSGWTVASWSGYAASLLVLLLWAVAHEWLAGVRAAVAARASGSGGRHKKAGTKSRDDSSGLGESLTTTNPTAPDAPSVVVVAASPASATLIFRVSGMTCDGCATRIEAALKRTAGVLSAAVTHASGTAVVQYEDVDVIGGQIATTLIDCITDLGYEAEEDAVAPALVVGGGAGAVAEQRFVAAAAKLDGGSGAMVLALSSLQMLSTYLLMLATMTFEVGVIAAVVLGRSLGQHCTRHRSLGQAGAAASTQLGGGGQLDCCTS